MMLMKRKLRGSCQMPCYLHYYCYCYGAGRRHNLFGVEMRMMVPPGVPSAPHCSRCAGGGQDCSC